MQAAPLLPFGLTKKAPLQREALIIGYPPKEARYAQDSDLFHRSFLPTQTGVGSGGAIEISWSWVRSPLGTGRRRCSGDPIVRQLPLRAGRLGANGRRPQRRGDALPPPPPRRA